MRREIDYIGYTRHAIQSSCFFLTISILLPTHTWRFFFNGNLALFNFYGTPALIFNSGGGGLIVLNYGHMFIHTNCYVITKLPVSEC